MPLVNRVLCGDSAELLKQFPNNSVDLVFTSPPYADKRKSTYGGVPPRAYVNWFLPIADQLYRVLKPSGSFMLNIAEHPVDGVIDNYVLELLAALSKRGWRRTATYYWTKKNTFPGFWRGRLRSRTEPIYQFTKTKDYQFNRDAVLVSQGGWAKSRLAKLGKNDVRRKASDSGSGFGKNISHWVNRTGRTTDPGDTLYLHTVTQNVEHSAAFPPELPAWFILLLTKPGDLVLDPFLGAGATLLAAKSLHRNYIGIDIVPKYCKISEDRLRREKHSEFNAPDFSEKCILPRKD